MRLCCTVHIKLQLGQYPLFSISPVMRSRAIRQCAVPVYLMWLVHVDGVLGVIPDAVFMIVLLLIIISPDMSYGMCNLTVTIKSIPL